MLPYLFTALALVLVIEGILPFLSPPFWRRMVISMIRLSDRALRTFGLCAMLLGVLLLYLVHH